MGNLNEIRDTIEKVTTSVEKVHQEIAHKPIEVVELIAPNLHPLTKTVGEVQAKIIGSIYDVIRGVNRAVAGIADDRGEAGGKPVAHAVPAKPEKKAAAPSVTT